MFGQFIDDSIGISPTVRDREYARRIHAEMCEWYTGEDKRRDRLIGLLRGYGIPVAAGIVPGSACWTDGHVVIQDHHPIYIQEMKNEIGAGGAEPSLQGLAYYDRFLHQPELRNDTSTCHPCMIVYLAGPHLGFAGCAMTERSTLEVFSLVPLAYHSSHRVAHHNLARHLAALKKALKTLEEYYVQRDARRSESPESERCAEPVDRLYPHPTRFHDLRTKLPSLLVYNTPLADRKLLFTAEANKEPICVKFVQRYGDQVHAWCAEQGFAPALIAVETLPGGWTMVVMERLDESWTCMVDINSLDRLKFQDKMKSVVERLNAVSMVHGDLRDTNVMVREGSEPCIMLLDFDWAGIAGQVTYPDTINRDIYRPEGVDGDGEIQPEHDVAMMRHMFN